MAKKESRIKPDSRNYRRHNEKNKRIIKKSLEELGAGRSILLDNDNSIIAGNGVYEQAQNLNIPIRIIETTGNELIAVKRTDIAPDSDKRKTLALVDNHASDTSDFDTELIAADFEVAELEKWEIDKERKGYFQEQLYNEDMTEIKIPYPITIVIDEKDYNIWQNIKFKYNETNNLRLFIKILKKLEKLEK